MESYEAAGIVAGCRSGAIDAARANELLADALIAGDLWITTGEPWADYVKRVGKANAIESVGGSDREEQNHYNRLEQVAYLEDRGAGTVRAHSGPQTMADGRETHDWTEGAAPALLARLLEPLATGCAPHKVAAKS